MLCFNEYFLGHMLRFVNLLTTYAECRYSLLVRLTWLTSRPVIINCLASISEKPSKVRPAVTTRRCWWRSSRELVKNAKFLVTTCLHYTWYWLIRFLRSSRLSREVNLAIRVLCTFSWIDENMVFFFTLIFQWLSNSFWCPPTHEQVAFSYSLELLCCNDCIYSATAWYSFTYSSHVDRVEQKQEIEAWYGMGNRNKCRCFNKRILIMETWQCKILFFVQCWRECRLSHQKPPLKALVHKCWAPKLNRVEFS